MVVLMKVLDFVYLLHQTAFLVVVGRYFVGWLFSGCFHGDTKQKASTRKEIIGAASRKQTANESSTKYDSNGLMVIELVLLQLLFSFVRPLPAFAIYFNVYHSLRHVLSVWAVVQAEALKRGAIGISMKTFLLVAVSFSVLAIALAGVTMKSLGMFEASGSTETFSNSFFVGIAAVTSPHFLLVEALWLFFRDKNEIA